MKKENIVGFRLSLYSVDDPQTLTKELHPDNAIDSIWIPQTGFETVADQIWVWYEFKNSKDKQNYIDKIKNSDIKAWSEFDKKFTYAKDMFMHDEDWLTQRRIDHWVDGKLMKDYFDDNEN